MNTAQARIAAQDAADRRDFTEAARLMQVALDGYPVMRGRNGYTAVQELDRANMRGRRDGWAQIAAAEVAA